MISVIIPTHKPHIQILEECLNSITNQKTDIPYEIILVENPVKTNEVRNLRVDWRKIRHEESILGSNESRNRGIVLSKYDWIVLTDDDCLWPENYISNLATILSLYPDAGIIGGAVKLKTWKVDEPKWLVGPLRKLLSELLYDFTCPTDIDGVLHRYLISANLCFSKYRYRQVGGLRTDIGQKGKEIYVSNDEIQFVDLCAKLGTPKMLYVPQLQIEHLIPPSRLTIEYLEKKAYGQGLSDAIMYREYLSVLDTYHDRIQSAFSDVIDEIMDARNTICNEPITREFIRYFIRVKTAYLTGAVHGTEK